MKILFIEDDEDKARKITDFLQSEFRHSQIITARSVNSGLKAIIGHKSDLDLILLDMTLPSFDPHVPDQISSSPENFAGRDILEQMTLREIFIPTLVVTMYDSFPVGLEKKSRDTLSDELFDQYSPTFKGLVYYNIAQEGWQKSLKNAVQKILNLEIE